MSVVFLSLKNAHFIEYASEIQHTSEKAKIQSLIDANNDLTDQNNISLSSKAKAKSYSSEVNLVNAFFTSNGYVLSSELLLHAYSNGELDSMYTPVHKDLITKSSVFQSIKTGTSLEGSNEFPNSGTVVDKDLYYAIHAFRFLKSPSGRVVNIEDRYDYAKSSNYPSISGVAVNWMYNAQEAGTLTPFFTSIAFSYDDMEVKNTTQDVQIGDVRMFEKAMGIGKKETRTFNVTFKRDGWKVLQTFGLVDTVLYLYDENGSLIKRDDDSGSGTNSYILLNASKNKKYKLVLKYLNDTKFGATRLVITNSFYDKDSNAESMDKYENIYSITNENFIWYSYVGEHHSHLLRIIPPMRGRFQIDAISEFDNYLYIIDPRSGFSTRNEDKNDDGGDGRNARITKDLNSGTNYLVIYSQYNPSATFSNYDSGDDLQIHLAKTKSL